MTTGKLTIQMMTAVSFVACIRENAQPDGSLIVAPENVAKSGAIQILNMTR